MLQKTAGHLEEVLVLVYLLAVQGSAISLMKNVTSSFYLKKKKIGMKLNMLFIMTVSQTVAELHIFLCSVLLA